MGWQSIVRSGTITPLRDLLAVLRVCILTIALGLGLTTQAQDDAQPGISKSNPLSGSVLSPDGSPVPDCKVTLSTFLKPLEAEHATTDAAGRFQFEHHDGHGFIFVAHPNHPIAARRLAPDSRRDNIQFQLQPPVEIPVQVVDAKGRPLADVSINVNMLKDRKQKVVAPIPIKAPKRIVKTNAEGSAVLTTAALADIYSLTTKHEAYGQQDLIFPTVTPNELKIKLLPVGKLKGRVTSEDQIALNGHEVFAHTFQQDASGAMQMGSASIVTDENGKFEIPAIAAGRLQFFRAPSSKNDSDYLPELPIGKEVTLGRTANVQIRLRKAVRVNGSVFEKYSRRGVPDISISLTAASNQAHATTQENGKFSLLQFSGSYSVFTYWPDLKGGIGRWTTANEISVPVDTKTFKVDLEYVLAEGRVVDDGGQPIANAEVVEVEWRSFSGGTPVAQSIYKKGSRLDRIMTGHSGAFRGWVNDNQDYRFTIEARPGKTQQTDWINFAERPTNKIPDLVFNNFHTITGQVVDTEGDPVDAVDLYLCYASPGAKRVLRSTTKSDENGRFEAVVPSSWYTSAFRQEIGLIASREGYSLGTLSFPRSQDPPSSGVKLVLAENLLQSKFQMVDPHGLPLSDATVRIASLASDLMGSIAARAHLPIPEPLYDRFTTKSDANGEVRLSGLKHADISAVSIESHQFGKQIVMATGGISPKPLPTKIAIGSVGRLTGRLVATDVPLAMLEVSVQSRSKSKDSNFEIGGQATVTTDDQGRFDIPNLATGTLSIQVKVPTELNLLARLPSPNSKSITDQGLEIEIPLQKAVTGRGVVREKDSHVGIEGVTIIYQNIFDSIPRFTKSDSQGQFEIKFLPGQLFVRASTPASHLTISADRRANPIARVPSGKDNFELKPIEFIRRAVLLGRIRDENGISVSQANVRAVWADKDPSKGLRRKEVSAISDNAGNFEIDGVDPQVELYVSADKQATRATTVVPVGKASDPIEMTLSPFEAISISGRVVDDLQRPIADATVQVLIKQRELSVGSSIIPGEIKSVTFEEAIKTDANGAFKTPNSLELHREYCVEIQVPGEPLVRSDWIKTTVDSQNGFAEIRITPTSVVRGLVVDHHDRPIPGVEVFQAGDDKQRNSIETDSDGRFSLRSHLGSDAFMFARKAGFRFHGQRTGPVRKEKRIVLHRDDAPSKLRLSTGYHALSRADRIEIARPIIETGIETLRTESNDQMLARSIEVLALIDPVRVLQHVDEGTVKSGFMKDRLRMACAKTLAIDEPDEALDLVASSAGGEMKIYGYTELLKHDSLWSKEQRLEILGRMLIQAKAISSPDYRVVMLAKIADLLIESGETQQAEPILREAAKHARKLPSKGWPGYARGTVAEELAQIDFEAALKLAENLEKTGQDSFSRHHGNMAHELAATNPAQAEQILNLIERPKDATTFDQRARYSERVCYRMAKTDLQRARKIANNVTDKSKRALAHAAIAGSLAESDKKQALDSLNQAFDALEESVTSQSDRFNGFHSASAIGGMLLPVAERINPNLVEPFLWRAVSFRLPPHVGETSNEQQQAYKNFSDAQLATMIARYDRELARSLLKPSIDYLQEPPSFVRPQQLFIAAAMTDPERFKSIVVEAAKDPKRQWNAMTFAKILVLRDDELSHELHSNLGQWYADVEDL